MFSASPISSEHSLQLGLHGSLIRFAPLAFVPQRQNASSYLPSPSVFLSISTDFTPTLIVPVAPKHSKYTSIIILPEVEPRSLNNDLMYRLRNALRPINPDNACTLRITAAAGTELAGAYSPRPFSRGKRGLQRKRLHPSRGVATSDFRPLRTIPSCCHP